MLQTQSYRDPHFNANSLNEQTILGYFCNPANPFYRQDSLNEQFRMQRLPMNQEDISGGHEYVLVHVNPPLFVIRLQYRGELTDRGPVLTPLEYYYIIAGTIYQAPDFGNLVKAKIAGCLHKVREAYNHSLNHLDYNATHGYVWDFAKTDTDKPSAKGKAEEQAKEPVDRKSTLFQRTRIDYLLRRLGEKFPVVEQQQIGPDSASSGTGTSVKSEKENTPGSLEQSNSGVGSSNRDETEPPPFKRIKTEHDT